MRTIILVVWLLGAGCTCSRVHDAAERHQRNLAAYVAGTQPRARLVGETDAQLEQRLADTAKLREALLETARLVEELSR